MGNKKREKESSHISFRGEKTWLLRCFYTCIPMSPWSFNVTHDEIESKPETRFSEILDLMNKLQLPFSYFTRYPDSI